MQAPARNQTYDPAHLVCSAARQGAHNLVEHRGDVGGAGRKVGRDARALLLHELARAPLLARARERGQLSSGPGGALIGRRPAPGRMPTCADADTLLECARWRPCSRQQRHASRRRTLQMRLTQGAGNAPWERRASRSSAAAAAAAVRARSSGKRSFSTSRRYRMPSRI